MSHDESKGGNPFDFDFEETLKKAKKEFEKCSKNFDKQLELQEKIWDENIKKIRENMENYSIFEPVELGEILSVFDFDNYGRRRRGYARRDGTRTYGERERFYEFVDNLDMSGFKNYTD